MPSQDQPLDGGDLVRLLDEQRARDAAEVRSRERWLRQQAAESARLSGLLLGAAERGAHVTIRTVAATSHRGELISVGADFCGVRSDAGAETYIRTGAISAVTPRTATRAEAQDERDAALDLRFAELLAQEVGDRPRVRIVAAGDPDPIIGDLESVGLDVLTVRLETAGSPLIYVGLDAVTEVTFTAG